MKKLLYIISFSVLLTSFSCIEDDENTPVVDKGFATGKVVDTKGNPIAHADIVVNNTQFYNTNILGQTNENGQYKIELTPGSWYIRGTIDVPFDDKTYTLDLDPETEGAFAGTEGAIRNLRWKLTGKKPDEFGGGGYYGGSIEIIGVWGFFDTDGVELTLKPVANLIDGSTGQTLTQNPEGSILQDVPLGKYELAARYVPENKPLEIRIRNKEQEFGTAVTDSFDPAYAGATGSYKITVEVKLPE